MFHVPTQNHRDHQVPKGVLIGAALLLAFALAATAAARFSGLSRGDHAAAQSVESRLLHFDDRDDGAIVVRDAQNDDLAALVAPGTNGFVRGVLRGLARERRQHEIGSSPPFRLTHWSDGRLTLEDVSTGRRIDLEAFGPTNAQAFARFLSTPGSKSAQ